MPPVILATVVDLSKIKMKWKETYVSEGLNRKVIPAMPKGIYSGLRLVQNLSSPRQVEVAVAPDAAHAAVCQSAAGFSTTYHDNAGASTILSLSSSSLDNQETVIVLKIVYTIGADTTADWIAYPIADWNALSAGQQGELIVLGTVNVPAAATNITTAMITMRRRTWAWENLGGNLSWSPLLRNSGFEHAEANGTYANAASYWTLAPGANALWKVQQTDPMAGASAIAMDHVLVGAQTASFFQAVGATVTPGQLLKYQLFIKNLKVAAGGSLQLWLRFVAADWVTNTDVTVTIPMTSVDAAYREISDTIAVPANCVQFVSAHIQHTLNQGTTGVSFRIDDFQVYLQPSASKPAGTEGRVRQHINTDQVVFEDANDYFLFYYGNAALMRQSVDQLIIERRDQNRTSLNPVQLALPTTRITRLGEDLINTEARALLPRITAPVSTTGGVDFTLMWESVPSGQVGYRKYVSATGLFIETVNAMWGGANWIADINTTDASKKTQSENGFRFDRKDVTTSAWLDSAWDPSAEIVGQVSTATAIGSQLLLPRPGLGIGNGVFIGPDGVVATPFRRMRYDSINFDTASTQSFWAATDNASSGTVGLGLNDGDAHLLFHASAISGSRGCARMRGGSGLTTGRSAFPVSTHPGFSIKFRMAGALTNRYDYFGHTDGGNLTDGFNSPMCTVIRSTSLGTSFRIHYEDTTNAEFTFDTGFSPTINVWYYMTLIVLGQSPGSFLFRIGTTPDWKSTDTISHVTTTAGNGNLQPDNTGFNWRWGMGCRTTDGVAKQIDLSWVEVFATKEYV